MADVEINDLAADTTPAAAAEFEFQNTAGGTSGKVTLANIAANMPAITSASDLTLTSSDLILSLGNGVDFSATANGSGTTSSELFDDYEEGTFTPVLSDGTNADATQTVQVGRYTKIGNRVHISLVLTTSALGTISGSLLITGLPFTSTNAASSSSAFVAGNGGGLALTAGTSVTGFVQPNASQIVMRVWEATTGANAMTEVDWSVDGNVLMSGTYEAA